MKKWFLLLSALMITSFVSAQTVIYHENFEAPSGGDSVTSSGTPTAWGINTRVYAAGAQCDSNFVQAGDTSYLTTSVINCTGYANVVLKFSHICKIELTDGGEIEVSVNNGPWTKLTGTQYINPGPSQFVTNSNKFNAYTYIVPNMWNYAVNDAKPLNSWWMPEQFDISALAAGQANVRVRFALRDGGVNGANYNHGWFIDNIQVLGAISELNPPVITYKPPIVQDTINNTGPFDIYAWIKDQSGIDTAWLVYTVNGGSSINIPMVWVSDSTYKATIPSYTWNTAISYYVHAVDNSLSSNSGNATTKNFYIKKGPYPVIIGTGTSGQAHPFDILWGYGRSASIYTQTEATQYGNILSLAWYVSSAVATNAPIKVYLKTTTATVFTADTWANAIAGATLVYDGTVAFSTVGWRALSLISPYNYSSGNLVVLCEANYTGSGTFTYPSFAYTTQATNTHMTYTADNTAPTGNGTLGTSRPNITIGFAPTYNVMFDAGIAQVSMPSGIVIPGTNVPVTVKLVNYSDDTLTSVKIKYKVDGIIQDSLHWTGTMYAGTVNPSLNIDTANFALGAHTIKAWTEFPNGGSDVAAINDTSNASFYVCSGTLSGNYTIGSGGDYATFNAALSNMMNCGISGPVTFNVMSGTYNERLSIPSIMGASATNTITFQSQSGLYGDVILRDSAISSATNYVVKLNGGDYFRFKNMTLQARGTSYANVVTVDNGSIENIFDGNKITAPVTTATSTDYALVYGPSSSSIDTANAFIKNTFENGSYGIYYSGPSGLEKSTNVLNNTFVNQYYTAIYLYQQNAPVIDGNSITTNSTYTTFYGMYLGYCNNNMKVRKNTIRLINGGYGIYDYYSTGVLGGEGLIANNMVSIGGANSSYGIINYYSKFQNVYYNSVNIYGSAGTGRAYYLYSSSSYTNNQIKDNIFAYTGTNTSGLAEYVDTPAAISNMNYNDLYSTGTNLGYWSGNIATLAAWKTATTKDTNSISVNPEYLTSSNLHTYSMNVLNLGKPIVGITDDIDGQPRSVTTPDMGADEFDLLSTDLAVLAVIAPSSSCQLSAADSIKVTVKNKGSNSLSNVGMCYKINGNAPVCNTFAGPIASGATMTYTFATPANLSAFGNYTITAYVSNPAEQNNSNDTARRTIYSGYNFITAGTYTQGFESTDYYGDWSKLSEGPDVYSWEYPYVGTPHSGANSARFLNNATNTLNDWLFSRCFPLEAGKTYEVSYWYRGSSTTTPSRLKLKYGLTSTPAAMLYTIDSLPNILSTTYAQSVKRFVAPATASYNFGWCAYSASGTQNMFIDDINIKYIPDQEAAVMNMSRPIAGCGLSNAEQVRIKIKNNGVSSINGNLTAYYKVGSAPAVSEPVTGTILSGDTLNFTFATPLNMVAPVRDSIFKIKAWIVLTGDPVPANDSVYKEVKSGFVPSSPIVTNDTVVQNYPATLLASSTGPVFWYTSAVATASFYTGPSYTTAPLTTTTNYYVEASTALPGAVKTIGTGTSTTSYIPLYGYYDYSWSSILFTSAELGFTGRIDTIAFQANTTAPYTSLDQRVYMSNVAYTAFPDVLPPVVGSMTNVYTGTVVWSGNGWYKIALQTPFNYDGVSSLQISWENRDGSYASGYPTFNYTTTAANDKARYGYADGAMPTVAGTATTSRPNIRFVYTVPGCNSARVPVTATVLHPAEDIALINIETPVTGCADLAGEVVSVKLFNNGIDTIENAFTLAYKVSGNPTPVSEIVNTDILPGDTIVHTFATPASMPVIAGDSIYQITVYGHNAADIYFGNDTLVKTVALNFTPLNPTVVEDTIIFGNPATLQASSPNTLSWYTVPTGGTSVFSGPVFNTPTLFDTTTYYVQAVGRVPGGVTTIGAGTSTTNYIPAYGYYNYSWSSILFTPAELGFYGRIDSIAFKASVTAPYNMLDQRIYMANVPYTAFPNADPPVVGSMTSVFTGDITWSGNGWYKLALQTPFIYDGTSSLEIAWENHDGSWSSGYPSFAYTTTTAATQAKYDYDDAAFPTVTGSLTSSRPNIYFSHETDGCPSDRLPVTAYVIIPQEDIAIDQIVTPNDGCTFGLEDVTIKFFNYGIDTIETPFTLGYKVSGVPTPVTEVVNYIMLPGDSMTHTFATPAVFNLTSGDSTFLITAFGANPGDIYFVNDTLRKNVTVSFSPADPTVTSDTVPYGTAATLLASSPWNLDWYTVPTGGTVADTGSSITTPPLYGNQTYYVEATSTLPFASVIIGTGTSTTSYLPTYGLWDYSWSSMLWTSAELGFGGLIDTIAFYSSATAPYTYLNQSIYMSNVAYTSYSNANPPVVAGMTNVYTGNMTFSGTGWHKIALQTPFVYDGTSSLEIAWMNNDGSWVSGYPNFRYTTTAAADKAKYDNDDGAMPTVAGTLTSNRPNVYFHAGKEGCPSHRIPVYAVVTAHPDVDASILDIVAPVSPTTLGVHNVDVVLKNYGLDTLENTNIAWTVNGVAQTPYAWSGSLLTGQSQTVTIGTHDFVYVPYPGDNVVTAWVDLVADTIPANDTASVIINAHGPYHGTYTLGGSSADFPSFTIAALALKEWGVSAAVDILVNTATYTEQVVFDSIPGISATNTITFRSATGNNTDVTLQFAGTTTDNYVLKLNNAEYMHFEDMTIKSTASATYGRVVELAGGANHNYFENNIIRSIISTSSSAAAIYSGSGAHDDYNRFIGNQIENGYYGVYFYGSSSVRKEGNHFIDNTITGWNYYGVYAYYNDSVRVIGNTIQHGPAATTNYGIYSYYCDNGSRFERNKIVSTSSGSFYGIYAYYNNSSATVYNNIANNFISQAGATGTAYGIYLYYSNYQNVYFNSVNINGGSATDGRAMYQSGGGNIKVVNNNFANTGGGYAYYVSSGSAVSTSNYNNLYTTGTDLAYWNANRIDLAALQTASSKDVNSKSVPPSFYSTHNLHTYSIDLYNAGTPIAGFTSDFDLETRNATTPCIGADEFTPPAVDAGAISIDAPFSPVGGGAQNVRVSVRNFGLNTLTSMTITFEVDGVLGTPYLWTGSLPSGIIDPGVLVGTFTFPQGATVIRAWTSLPNGSADPNHLNDTTSVSVMSCAGPLAGTYTIGGASSDYTDFNEAVLALRYCGVSGPVVFNVLPGTYDEQVLIQQVAGASATNTITFQSQTSLNTDVTLQYAAQGSVDNFVLKLDTASFLRFNNMTIKSTTSTTYGKVVVLSGGASNNNFKGDIIQSIVSSSSNAVPVYSTSGRSENFNVFEGNNIQNGYYGIYFYGSSTYPKLSNDFVNNNITGYNYYGLYLAYNDTVNVSGNHIVNGSAATTNYPVYLYYCGKGAQVIGNDIIGNSNGSFYGIELYYSDGTSASQSLIANNFISYTTGTGTAYGVYIYYSDYAKVVYNSVNISGGSISGGRALYSTGATYLTLLNNNFVNSGSGYAYYVSGTGSLAASDYNNIYTPSTTYAYYGSASVANLAALSTASGMDTNSVSADPVFVSATDLHATSSVVNAVALPLAYITSDIDGDVRNATLPDIGADEFTPLAKDISVTAFILPSATYSPVGTSVNVTIRVRNLGSDTISSFGVHYKYGALLPVNATWTGTLAPAATVDYAFVAPFSAVNGTQSLCAYTTLAGDGNVHNDTLCRNFIGVPVLVVPDSTDFETVNNWYTDGTLWEYGIPTSDSINYAHSPVNVWKTNLDGQYGNSVTEYLYTPYYNFTQVNDATLKFWHWYETEENYDYGKIEYNITGTTTWISLGYVGDPAATNWYNGTTTSGAVGGFMGNSSGWVQSSFNLSTIPAIVNATVPVQFRFKFASDISSVGDGWAIDDFAIIAPPLAKDAGVIAVVNPIGSTITGDDITLQVTLKNFGTDSLMMIPVGFRINGGATTQSTWTGILLPGATTNYTFPTTYVSPGSTYDICAFTKRQGDIYKFNDTTCVSMGVSPAALDAGVVALISPTATTIFGDSVAVTIRIKNFGSTALTSIPLGYSRNGVQLFTTTWTGSLAAGDSLDYTFTKKYVSPLSLYSLCAYSMLPNDANALNDQKCLSPEGVIGIDEFGYSGFKLWQNVPNPATGNTSIMYQIPQDGKVSFDLYNMFGQVIMSLEQEALAGQNTFEIDVDPMAVGVYYYAVTYEGKRLTKKMVIR